MIIETAELIITEGQTTAFEAAFAQAVEVFRQAEGCLGIHLQRCIEEPNTYQAIIRWTTLEAHTVGFRESALFQEWRALVSPFFAEAPKVAHFEISHDKVMF